MRVLIGGASSKIKDAVFGNVGTMMNFKVGAEDAEYFEKEYAPLLSAQDILSIANYKAYVKLNIDNTTSRVFSMDTLYDPSKKNEKVLAIMKKYSRMKYGRKKEFVDAEIEARMGIDSLNTIDEAAKADTTVNDNLLGDTPIPTENEESINANSQNLQAQVATEAGAGNFAPKKIPEVIQQNVSSTPIATQPSEPVAKPEKISPEPPAETNTSTNDTTNQLPPKTPPTGEQNNISE